MKLYYSPGAVSLVTHIALEEAGMPYTTQAVLTAQGEQLRPEYRAVHSLARVPALELDSGEILTETPALLWYVSSLVPEFRLMPRGTLAEARANEWMGVLSSAVHIAFISFFRPERFMEAGPGAEALRSDGRQRFWDMLRYVEGRLPAEGFLFGERYSLVDAYAALFLLWGQRFEFPVAQLTRYAQLTTRVLRRPAVRRALDQEGLSAAYASADAAPDVPVAH